MSRHNHLPSGLGELIKLHNSGILTASAVPSKRDRKQRSLFEAKADSDRPRKPEPPKPPPVARARPAAKRPAAPAEEPASSSSSCSSQRSFEADAAADSSSPGDVSPASDVAAALTATQRGKSHKAAPAPDKPAADKAAPAPRWRKRSDAVASSSTDPGGDGAAAESAAAAAPSSFRRAGRERGGRSEQHRESHFKRQQVMSGLEPLQQLLMLGFVPDEADQDVWADFGTLANGKIDIRPSLVQTIVGENALGRGLFACRDFAVNETITVYGGELITDDEARLRRDTRGSQSHRYLMRISDSDFLVDGWHYASGISEAPNAGGGVFLPTREHATMYSQGAGPMANHDTGHGANASVSFIPLARCEAFQLFPRVPTLKANRPIKSGEEIKFNYGSKLPFCPEGSRALAASESSAAEMAAMDVGGLELSRYWSDIEWEANGVDAGVMRAALSQLQEHVQQPDKFSQKCEALTRAARLLATVRPDTAQAAEAARLVGELRALADRLHRTAGATLQREMGKDGEFGAGEAGVELQRVRQQLGAEKAKLRDRQKELAPKVEPPPPVAEAAPAAAPAPKRRKSGGAPPASAASALALAPPAGPAGDSEAKTELPPGWEVEDRVPAGGRPYKVYWDLERKTRATSVLTAWRRYEEGVGADVVAMLQEMEEEEGAGEAPPNMAEAEGPVDAGSSEDDAALPAAPQLEPTLSSESSDDGAPAEAPAEAPVEAPVEATAEAAVGVAAADMEDVVEDAATDAAGVAGATAEQGAPSTAPLASETAAVIEAAWAEPVAPPPPLPQAVRSPARVSLASFARLAPSLLPRSLGASPQTPVARLAGLRAQRADHKRRLADTHCQLGSLPDQLREKLQEMTESLVAQYGAQRMEMMKELLAQQAAINGEFARQRQVLEWTVGQIEHRIEAVSAEVCALENELAGAAVASQTAAIQPPPPAAALAKQRLQTQTQPPRPQQQQWRQERREEPPPSAPPPSPQQQQQRRTPSSPPQQSAEAASSAAPPSLTAAVPIPTVALSSAVSASAVPSAAASSLAATAETAGTARSSCAVSGATVSDAPPTATATSGAGPADGGATAPPRLEVSVVGAPTKAELIVSISDAEAAKLLTSQIKSVVRPAPEHIRHIAKTAPAPNGFFGAKWPTGRSVAGDKPAAAAQTAALFPSQVAAALKPRAGRRNVMSIKLGGTKTQQPAVAVVAAVAADAKPVEEETKPAGETAGAEEPARVEEAAGSGDSAVAATTGASAQDRRLARLGRSVVKAAALNLSADVPEVPDHPVEDGAVELRPVAEAALADAPEPANLESALSWSSSPHALSTDDSAPAPLAAGAATANVEGDGGARVRRSRWGQERRAPSPVRRAGQTSRDRSPARTAKEAGVVGPSPARWSRSPPKRARSPDSCTRGRARVG